MGQRGNSQCCMLLKNKKITNGKYQKMNDVSRRTATRDLTELVEIFNIVIQAGSQGAGSYLL